MIHWCKWRHVRLLFASRKYPWCSPSSKQCEPEAISQYRVQDQVRHELTWSKSFQPSTEGARRLRRCRSGWNWCQGCALRYGPRWLTDIALPRHCSLDIGHTEVAASIRQWCPACIPTQTPCVVSSVLLSLEPLDWPRFSQTTASSCTVALGCLVSLWTRSTRSTCPPHTSSSSRCLTKLCAGELPCPLPFSCVCSCFGFPISACHSSTDWNVVSEQSMSMSWVLYKVPG